MLFENNNIAINQLPNQENLVFVTLKPAFKTVVYINWSLFFLLLSIIPYTIEPIFEFHLLRWWLIVYYVLCLIAYFFFISIAHYGFPMKGYALREHDIVYRTGFINRKTITVPFNRIQHSEIRQSMIARMLNISKLRIFTAGGQGSGLFIHGLSPETAQQLKDFLSKKVSQYE